MSETACFEYDFLQGFFVELKAVSEDDTWEPKTHGNPKQPWEPKTFFFRGYNPYIGGLKPSFFMVLGSKGIIIAKESATLSDQGTTPCIVWIVTSW